MRRASNEPSSGSGIIEQKMEALRNNKVKIFLTVFLVYLFYIAPDYITSGTNRYIDLTKAVVDDRTFAIDKHYDNTRDLAFYKGHYYMGAAPGVSLAAVPIYATLKPLFKLIPPDIYKDLEFNILNLFFAIFLSVLPGALIAVLLYDLLEEFNLKQKERMLIVFTLSFGTILFYYSTRFIAHTIAAFMLFSAFYIFFKSRNQNGTKFSYFLAGACLGMAVLSEYTLIIGALLIVAYALYNFKKDRILHYGFLVLGLSLTSAMFMYYHYKCFDNPFALATTYSQMVGPIPLTLPRPRIIYELSFGTYRGLFMYMPILLVSLYGIYTFFRKPKKKYLPEMLLISFYSFLVFLTVSIYSNKVWGWGGDFGPRYFIGFIPFLAIPIAFAFKKIKYKIVAGIAILSILINWCGVQYGDADNAFINVGLFVFRGLNSNLAQWTYKLVTTYVRKLNVTTHFSPLVGFSLLLILIYLIWKAEIERLAQLYFCKAK